MLVSCICRIVYEASCLFIRLWNWSGFVFVTSSLETANKWPSIPWIPNDLEKCASVPPIDRIEEATRMNSWDINTGGGGGFCQKLTDQSYPLYLGHGEILRALLAFIQPLGSSRISIIRGTFLLDAPTEGGRTCTCRSFAAASRPRNWRHIGLLARCDA